MATHPLDVALPEFEKEQAAKLYRLLLHDGIPCLLGRSGEKEYLTPSVYELLRDVLANLQEGKAVAILPLLEELTTQKAADILGVSRQFFVRLLDEGKMQFHRTGTHRRLYLKDVLEYKHDRDAQRQRGIRAIAQAAVDSGDYETFITPEE